MCRVYVVWWCSFYLDLGFLVVWVVWGGVWLLILVVGGLGLFALVLWCVYWCSVKAFVTFVCFVYSCLHICGVGVAICVLVVLF